MPTTNDPYQAEPDDHVCTEPLEDENGETYQICQQPVGAERVVGGGEFPSPSTPPRSPAPGSAPPTRRRDPANPDRDPEGS